IPPGEITVYDVLRILPFGGTILRAEMDGVLVERVLITGVNNEGTGGFLQTSGVRRESGVWIVGGKPLEATRRYRVAINDFLLTGGEVNLGYLTRANPQVHDIVERRDIRHAVIDELSNAKR
ncbi:MAG: 5'-nucleotidase, partial [Burkholderiales bacterium]